MNIILGYLRLNYRITLFLMPNNVSYEIQNTRFGLNQIKMVFRYYFCDKGAKTFISSTERIIYVLFVLHSHSCLTIFLIYSLLTLSGKEKLLPLF